MKRFIDLTGQIQEDNKPIFAFFCTQIDQFELFNDTQIFETVDEFKEDFDGIDIDRYLNLIPKQFQERIIKFYT